MKKINWGIIGCGDVTEHKSGPAFNKVPGSSLVAVMRRNEEKAADYAQRHQVPTWYNDSHKLIHDPNVNAIYVATPPSTHKEYAIAAMKAGKPVYVEKPMALNYAECEEMNKISAKTGVPLFVAYYRRQLPGYLKVQELISQGRIGDVRLVNIRMYSPPKPGDMNIKDVPWRITPEISGGGHFVDLASHQLDYLDYLFGPVEKAAGYSFNQAQLYRAEDVVAGSMMFESGALCSGVWTFTTSAAIEKDEIEIVGSKGKIVFSTFDFSPIKLQSESGDEEFENVRPEHVQKPLIEMMVKSLQGNGECVSTGVSAARTTWVMDKMVSDYLKLV